jgi:hypothetical protein
MNPFAENPIARIPGSLIRYNPPFHAPGRGKSGQLTRNYPPTSKDVSFERRAVDRVNNL